MARRSGRHAVTSDQIEQVLAHLRSRVNAPGNTTMAAVKADERVKVHKEADKLRKKRESERKKVLATSGTIPTRRGTDIGPAVPEDGGQPGVNDPTNKGRKFHELSDKNRKQILLNDAANREADELGAEPKKDDKSIFNRVMDVLSRGMYGAAEAVKDNQEAYYQERGKKSMFMDGAKMPDVGAEVKALGKGIAAGFEGFGQGFSGKEKTTFSDTIQEIADNRKAIREGRTANESRSGEAKVNKVVKHGVGFALDVFADPTTYAGVGLVSKAAKVGETGRTIVKSSTEIADELEKTAEVFKKTKANSKLSDDVLLDALAVHKAPVRQLSRADIRRLSPDARRLVDVAKAAQKGSSTRRAGVGDLNHLGRTSEMGLDMKATYREIGLQAAKNDPDLLRYRNEIDELKKKKKRASGKEQKLRALESTLADDYAKNLAAAALRNLSPEVKNSLKVRLGKASITIPGVAAAATGMGRQMTRIPKVADSVKWYNDSFRARAYIPRSMSHLRRENVTAGGRIIVETTRELQSIYNKIDKATRHGVMTSWKLGNSSGGPVGGLNRTGEEVSDLVTHLDEWMSDLAATVTSSGYKNAEINQYLPKALQFKESDHLTETVNKGGGAVKVPKYDVDPERIIREIKNNDKITDPAQTLLHYTAAINKVAAKHSMLESAAKAFGVHGIDDFGTGSVTKPIADMLKSGPNGWRTVKSDAMELKGVYFHPDAAFAIERMEKVFGHGDELTKFGQEFDRANQMFKGIVTKYNPSFHTRTFMGEFLLGYLGGMRHPLRSYRHAAIVMHGRNRELLGEGIPAASKAMGRMHNTLNVRSTVGAANRVAKADPAKRTIPTKFGKLSPDQVNAYYQASGLKAGYASTELVRGEGNKIGKFAVNPLQKSADVAVETVEDFGRMAHFIDVLQHTNARTFEDALREASETVSKYHLDYSEVTDLERRVMSRIIPFYKWLRLSTPLMADVLLTQPGKAMVMPKAMQAISGMVGYDTQEFGALPGGPDEVVPKWLRDAGAVPVGENFGNTQYFNPQAIFPLSSSIGLLGEGGPTGIMEKAWGATTPLAKAPAELALNESPFQRDPRENPTELLKYAASQTPQSSAAYQLSPNSVAGKRDPGIERLQTLLAFLSNPGIQPNTEKRMGSEIQREKDAANKRRRQIKDELGLK